MNNTTTEQAIASESTMVKPSDLKIGFRYNFYLLEQTYYLVLDYMRTKCGYRGKYLPASVIEVSHISIIFVIPAVHEDQFDFSVIKIKLTGIAYDLTEDVIFEHPLFPTKRISVKDEIDCLCTINRNLNGPDDMFDIGKP